MLRLPKVAACWCAGMCIVASSASAQQWFPWAKYNNNCDCAPPISAPAISTAAISHAAYDPCACTAPTVTAVTALAPVVQTACAPVQPVMQTVYRQVPVIEHQPVRQAVKKPIVETKYVEQPVTEYVPVTEVKTVNIPTVSYQDVTEYQTVFRNMGYYRTRYEPNVKVAGCEIDPRPGMTGWFNRTIHDFRTSMTPDQRAIREYIPQTVAQTVPVTRRVAINGSRQVSYNVTTMAAAQSTKRVAVNTVRYVDDEVTVMKPITVVKTMAVGTQMTYAPIGAVQSAQQPQPDPNFSRSVKRNDALDQADPVKLDRRSGAVEPSRSRLELQPTSLPQPEKTEPPRVRTGAANVAAAQPSFTAPTAARVNQWVARTTKTPSPSPAPSAISVADADRP